MNRMTDGITNYGALPGSIYDQPPEESEAVFVPPEFAGSFSTDSKYPTSRDSSSPNSGAHDSAATPTMSESLAQRRRDMVARCTEEAKRAGKKLLFGMTTSLALQSVPIPADCDLDSAKLHTVSSVKSKRFRTRHAPLQTHIWKHAAKAANVEMNQHVFALDLFHVWAQLAPYVSFESLIVLGDAVIAATSKQPVLAKDRDAAAIYQDLVRFVEQFTRFRGRPSCVRALPLISPGADSPKESEERLSLVASKTQWRRDQEKRGVLVGRRWLVFVATAASIANEDARAEFAFNVARALASRGAVFEFHVVAMSLEELSQSLL